MTEKTEQGLRRLFTLRARSRVLQVCHVIVGFHVLRVDVSLDLGFHVVIGVGRLIVQRDGVILNCISPRIRNTKCKVLFFWMLESDSVLSSSTQSVSQIFADFTSRKRVFCVVFTPPVGYSRPPSAVNDRSVTKKNEFLKAMCLRFSPKFCKQRVAPFDRKPLLATSFLTFFEFLGRPPGFSPLPPGGGRTRCRSPFLVLPVGYGLELMSSSILV